MATQRRTPTRPEQKQKAKPFALHEAVKNLDLPLVQQLISKKANVNELNQANESPLDLAVTGSDREACPIVVELLRAKAELKGKESMLLGNAAHRGRVEIVKVLLQSKGVKPAAFTMERAITQRDREMVEVLLEAGAPIDPIELALTAADTNSLDIIKIVGKKAPQYLRNPEVLYRAADAGQTELVKAVLEAKANVNARFGAGYRPLSMAYFKGHYEVAKILLAAGAIPSGDDWSYINMAEKMSERVTSESRLPVLLQLFAAFPQGDSTSFEYYKALQTAVINKKPPAVIAALLAAETSFGHLSASEVRSVANLGLAKRINAHEDVIQLLQQALNRKRRVALVAGLWRKPEPKAESDSRWQAKVVKPKKQLSLSEAIDGLNLPAVRACIKVGANVNQLSLSSFGTTLLGEVVGKSEQEALPIVSALLAEGASVDESLPGNESLLLKALDGGRRGILQALLATKKTNPNQMVDLEHGYRRHISILEHAVNLGDERTVQLLLQAKARVSADEIQAACWTLHLNKLVPTLCSGEFGDKPEIKGAALLHLVLEARLTDRNALSELITANKADIDKPNEEGELPLCVAAQKENVAAVELLLEAKANAAVVDAKGDSILHRLAASQCQKLSIYTPLILAKADVNSLGAVDDAGHRYTVLQLAVKQNQPRPALVSTLLTLKAEARHVTTEGAIYSALALAKRLKSHQRIIDILERTLMPVSFANPLLAMEEALPVSETPAVMPPQPAMRAGPTETALRLREGKQLEIKQASKPKPHTSSLWAELQTRSHFEHQIINLVLATAGITAPKPGKAAS